MSQYDPELVRFHIDIYIPVSFGGHNLDTSNLFPPLIFNE